MSNDQIFKRFALPAVPKIFAREAQEAPQALEVKEKSKPLEGAKISPT